MPKKTEGYARRLQRALEHGPRPMSVRALGDRMKTAHEGLRGATYSGVRQYVKGRVRTPRMELLRALAAELGVRWQWLAYADGAMTEAGQRAQDEVSASAVVGSSGLGEKDRAWQQSYRFKWEVLQGLGMPHPDTEADVEEDGLPAALRQWAVDHNERSIPPWVPALMYVGARVDVEPRQLGEAIAGLLSPMGVDPLSLPGGSTPGTSNRGLNDLILALVPVLSSITEWSRRRQTQLRP